MNGKEILLAALRGEKTPRPAWLPFVGVHGGYLIGETATDYLQSSELMVKGLKRACELYRPDGLPIAFDLQIEAEILGCQLQWLDEVPPAVVSHPLAEGEIGDLHELDETRGRFPLVIEALEGMQREVGEEVALYGLICGPFTLALHLLGNDLFLDIIMAPERVGEVIAYCAEVGKKAADVYIDHGADVVAVVDPMTSQISPEHFAEFITPHVDAVFDHIRDREGLSSLFVCGDATRSLELLCDTHADNISVDEQIPMARLSELCLEREKSFGGNIKLTSVLLLGDEEDARLETVDIIDQSGAVGFVLAPGCDLPYSVPEGNLQAVAEMVHDEYRRQVVRASVGSRQADDFADVVLPDYEESDEVIVDVITLDSTSCAPCQYMMEAVEAAAAKANGRVRVVEHKIKTRQGLGMMSRLGVEKLPTICIDGTERYASIIPDQETLVRAIEARGKEKMEQRSFADAAS